MSLKDRRLKEIMHPWWASNCILLKTIIQIRNDNWTSTQQNKYPNGWSSGTALPLTSIFCACKLRDYAPQSPWFILLCVPLLEIMVCTLHNSRFFIHCIRWRFKHTRSSVFLFSMFLFYSEHGCLYYVGF